METKERSNRKMEMAAAGNLEIQMQYNHAMQLLLLVIGKTDGYSLRIPLGNSSMPASERSKGLR